MRDHVGQLHCVLGGEGCCVVLKGHNLTRFMRYIIVYLRRLLRIANLFRILSLGRDGMHDVERVIPRLLIVVHSHHHILLCSCFFKQVQERDVPCVRRRLVVMMRGSDSRILRLFKVVHAFLSLHLCFEFMSARMSNS